MPVPLLRLSPRFGSQIHGVDLGVLDAATFDQLYAAWLKHHVLVLRNQTISDTQFEAFSARLGTLDPPPNQGAGRKSPPGFPNLYVISNKKDGAGEPIGALGDPIGAPRSLPVRASLPAGVKLEVQEHGGHVGFLHGPPWAPRSWAETRAVEFLSGWIPERYRP